MLLDVKNLDKSYGGVHVLKDISFFLEAGSVVGLVGNNGAGKSTLMKCLAGAENPDSGDILFNSKSLARSTPDVSREAGIEMIYQHRDLCPQFDVISNIFLGREITKTLGVLDSKAMRQKAGEILARINANIPLDAVIDTLSGGQQQAVAIARALLSSPKLVIMDEPTASLGIAETNKVIELVQALKKNGIAVILISHRLSDIFSAADRILMIQHGEIKQDVPLDQTSPDALAKQLLS